MTIFIKSQIKSELKLDYIILEKKSGANTLCLMITPLPDINIDNLIFGGKEDSEQADKSAQDSKDDLMLKISDTRQKIDVKVDYKDTVFLGELANIDFELK